MMTANFKVTNGKEELFFPSVKKGLNVKTFATLNLMVVGEVMPGIFLISFSPLKGEQIENSAGASIVTGRL